MLEPEADRRWAEEAFPRFLSRRTKGVGDDVASRGGRELGRGMIGLAIRKACRIVIGPCISGSGARVTWPGAGAASCTGPRAGAVRAQISGRTGSRTGPPKCRAGIERASIPRGLGTLAGGRCARVGGSGTKGVLRTLKTAAFESLLPVGKKGARRNGCRRRFFRADGVFLVARWTWRGEGPLWNRRQQRVTAGRQGSRPPARGVPAGVR